MSKLDFLFELGCEELPSAAVLALSEALKLGIEKNLRKMELSYEKVTSFATPRRLAVLVNQLESKQAPQVISRRGPTQSQAYDKEGNPTQALLGFAKSCGVEVADLTVIKTEKGEWMQFEATNPGVDTSTLLPNLMAEAIAALPISKPMRWGEGETEFARPIHWLLMLYGPEVISSQLLGVQSGKLTYGHRFHHPQPLVIANPDDYESLLYEAYVVADFSKRRELIRNQILAIAASYQAQAIIPPDLLDEVTSIVEWPQALIVDFNVDFLKIPKEVLLASMHSHQKCFALEDNSGNLLPHFITVSNLKSQNVAQVVHGNEQVMHARLSDAQFFFENDGKTPLASLRVKTEKVIFQAKLGTLFDKSERMKNLIQSMLDPLQLLKADALRAAELSQCDLLTGMVGEFPELQGLMGYYYAKRDGESLDIAVALKEQYMPRFAGDALPATPLGTALSLADRMDTLVGAFLLGGKPSGDKDPFKLRRHALAVVRILLQDKSALLLSTLISEAAKQYPTLHDSDKSQLNELPAFILDRLHSFYQGRAISTDKVNAVLAKQNDSLFDVEQRLLALDNFVKLPAALTLSAACKRVNNLLNSAKMTHYPQDRLDKSLLQDPAEINLALQIELISKKIALLLPLRDYQGILFILPSLAEAIDVFFDTVMIMVEEEQLKHNRLLLLIQLQGLLQCVADISLLQ